MGGVRYNEYYGKGILIGMTTGQGFTQLYFGSEILC